MSQSPSQIFFQEIHHLKPMLNMREHQELHPRTSVLFASNQNHKPPISKNHVHSTKKSTTKVVQNENGEILMDHIEE